MTPSSSCAIGASCRRAFEKVSVASFGIIPSRSCTCEEFCGLLDWSSSFHMCPEHTKPLIELFKEKKFLLKSIPYARTLISSMMVPLLNSVVFYYKTTLWSCLSWTTCSHVCSRTSSCLELAIVVHLPRIPQRHLVDLCCKLPFFFLDSMSLEYPDTNQIWISGRCDGWNISQEL